MGVRLNPPASRPDDPYTKERQKVRWGCNGSNGEYVVLIRVLLLLVL